MSICSPLGPPNKIWHPHPGGHGQAVLAGAPHPVPALFPLPHVLCPWPPFPLLPGPPAVVYRLPNQAKVDKLHSQREAFQKSKPALESFRPMLAQASSETLLWPLSGSTEEQSRAAAFPGAHSMLEQRLGRCPGLCVPAPHRLLSVWCRGPLSPYPVVTLLSCDPSCSRLMLKWAHGAL